jgi:uncharacterized membrane protein YphA (DoxX/SURF4 family)
VGLLLIRLAVGTSVCCHGIALLRNGTPPTLMFAGTLHIGLGALIVIGLWTPVVGALLAFIAFVDAYSYPELRWYCVLTGTVAAGTALIGPGRWSLDSQIFGWKRVEIPDRKRPDPPT